VPALPPRPELVAHRGWARRFPENTRAALRGAVEAGARWLETDVQLSSDGVPVLFHDRTLARLCGVAGALHERSAVELAALCASEPERFGTRFADEPLATLVDLVRLLQEAPDVRAFVEVKRVALEAFGCETLWERTRAVLAPVLERCVVISFSIDFMAWVRRASDVPIAPVIERWSDLERPEVRALGAELVFCDKGELPPEGPLDAHGARLAVYEVDDPREALALAARGVALVETFAIGEMLAALGGRAR
jgi:glycerophosphoryl diester phosphodiesterase